MMGRSPTRQATDTVFSQVITDGAYTLLAPERGQHPATALALVRGGEAWAHVALVPRVRVTQAEGLDEEAQQALVGIARLHRDALLEGWAAPTHPRGTAGPRAIAISHDARKRVFTMRLETGAALRFPLDAVEALGGQPDEALAEVFIAANGEALSWPTARVALRVSEVILGVTGGAGWRDALVTALLEPWLGHQGETLRHEPPRRPAPTPPAPRIRSLVGLILHREGTLTAEAAQAIADRQQTLRSEGTDLSFGQVGLELGLVEEEQLHFALLVQDRLSQAPGDTKPLAIFLMEAASLSPSQLLKALEEQATSGHPLGEILVRWKVVGADIVETFAARQRDLRRPSPPGGSDAGAGPRVTMSEGGPTIDIEARTEPGSVPRPPGGDEAGDDEAQRSRALLGLILEREGYLTQAQLRHIAAELKRARKEGRPVAFGEMALRLEVLTSEQLRFAISMQKRLTHEAGPGKPLWATMLESGVLKPSQLLLAMDEGARSGRKVEELLIEQGVVSESVLAVFKRMHEERR
ncbi:MAG: hypothetical protein VKQ33_08420 [Candidatus Sericytochromatia bacterium]|nr:hypothetical protein [Candidatus Sericytochromatia bacterium]